MDLHLTPGRATDEERAAVDELLGAPESGWHGAERDELDPPRGARRPRRPGRTPSAAARAARAPGPRGLDQRGRPELRVRAAHGAARRGVRGGHVLRDVQRGAAALDGGPRLRRPRVPRERREGGLRPASTARSARRARRRPTASTWHTSPCLGMCEQAPGGAVPASGHERGDVARRAARSATAGAVDQALIGGGRARNDRRSTAAGALARPPDPRRPQGLAAPQAHRSRRPRLVRRLPRARRLPRLSAGRSSWAPRARSARSPTPS